MAASVGDEFDVWLSDKLSSYNLDEAVLCPYVKGILESDETKEEKSEGIGGIFSEVSEDDIAVLCEEILNKWQLACGSPKKPEGGCKVDMNIQISRIMQQQQHAAAVTNTNAQSADHKKLKEAILGQVSQMSGDEEEGEGECESSGPLLMKNKNVDDVMKAEREKKEKAKEKAEEKRQRDKMDREKQKQVNQERKDKAQKKAAKVERRR